MKQHGGVHGRGCGIGKSKKWGSMWRRKMEGEMKEGVKEQPREGHGNDMEKGT